MYIGKRFRSGIIIVLVFIIYFIVTYINQQEILESKNNVLLDIKANIEIQKTRKAELEAEINMIDSVEYVEIQARNKLGFVKDGETVFVDSNK